MAIKDKAIALTLALCATAAAVAALASPAGAAYGNGFQLARFKVEVKGWQTMVQQHTHQATEPCDVEDFSSGSEKVSFSSKPFVVTASYYPGEENPEFFSGKSLGIPTKAVVKRSYTPRITAPNPNGECGENGGGVETRWQSDCGTKVVKPYKVKLGYVKDQPRSKLMLITETTEDPFEECPGSASSSFPYLITLNSKEDFIGADLSQKELFDPNFQKWISIARGTHKVQLTDYWYKTTLHWEVSFTRLKTKLAH
jgi:hypothetical protein